MNKKIYIGLAGKKGRGVFTSKKIKQGELIEVAPVVVLSEKDTRAVVKTGLYDYYFMWGENDKQSAIGLGYASIYNHSYKPNAAYTSQPEDEILVYRAIRNIEAHEEITVNYNCDHDSRKKVWFKIAR